MMATFSSTLLIAFLAQDASIPRAKPASIVPMERFAARDRVMLALTEKGSPSPMALEKIATFWAEGNPILDAVVQSTAVADPRLQALLDVWCKDSRPVAEFTKEIDGLSLDPFLRANLMSYMGRELARRRLFDEALSLLNAVDDEESVDPASLYFYRGTCQFALHQTDAAKQSLGQLLQVNGIPTRYQGAADVMIAALELLAPESLGGIAHDMKDVERRLDLRQTDKKILAMEEDILARLDKLIEDMENQSKGDSDSKSSGGAPSTPAEESRLLGGEGPGEVDDKKFDADADWGNLPDKDREKALQEVGRDFPGHYRDAIEQYFRKLATPKS